MIGAIVFTASILSSYLIGSVPTSYIMAKLSRGVDIRREGSGNVGATNVLRVVGRVPALIVLILDIGKGVIAVTLLANLFSPFLGGWIDRDLFRVVMGLSVITGHVWTVFLKFKGGKGVATTVGVVASLAPSVFMPSLLVWIIIFVFTNYVSLASLAFGVALPVFSLILNKSIYLTFFSVTICILLSYKHVSNIRRLLKGEENKTIIIKRRG